MIEEQLTDLERRLLMRLVIEAMPPPDKVGQVEALTALVSKLSGTDTVVVARRAYRSRRSLNARV